MCNWLSILIISKTKPSHSNQEDAGDAVFEIFSSITSKIEKYLIQKISFNYEKTTASKLCNIYIVIPMVQNKTLPWIYLLFQPGGYVIPLV